MIDTPPSLKFDAEFNAVVGLVLEGLVTALLHLSLHSCHLQRSTPLPIRGRYIFGGWLQWVRPLKKHVSTVGTL